MSARLSSETRASDRFAGKRRQRRRRILIAAAVLLCLVIGAGIYGARQEAVRIAHVQVFGAESYFAEYAYRNLQGGYLGIVPRDSTFFFPQSRIRREILREHPEIAAVSVFRNGFDAISLKIMYRTAVARWCGLSPTPGVEEYCYVFDANGFVFAPASSSTPPINAFALYAQLAGETEEPLGASLAHPERIPAAFDFARKLAAHGSPVLSVVMRGDEADDLLASGTRVTYLLGQEETAYAALVSAGSQMNLADGSVEYADLRFEGKVYLKRRGE